MAIPRSHQGTRAGVANPPASARNDIESGAAVVPEGGCRAGGGSRLLARHGSPRTPFTYALITRHAGFETIVPLVPVPIHPTKIDPPVFI